MKPFVRNERYIIYGYITTYHYMNFIILFGNMRFNIEAQPLINVSPIDQYDVLFIFSFLKFGKDN